MRLPTILRATCTFTLAACATTGATAGSAGKATISAPAVDAGGSSQSSSIFGTWERLSGGVGETAIFSRENVFTLVVGTIVDDNYDLKGNALSFFDERGPSETQALSFVGDTAILSSKDCRVKLIPLEGPNHTAGSLVGKWRSAEIFGGASYWEFTSEGLARVRTPAQVDKGTFSVSGNTIALHDITPVRRNSRVQFRLKGDTLTLYNHAGARSYLRAAPLIPLDIEPPPPPTGRKC